MHAQHTRKCELNTAMTCYASQYPLCLTKLWCSVYTSYVSAASLFHSASDGRSSGILCRAIGTLGMVANAYCELCWLSFSVKDVGVHESYDSFELNAQGVNT